MKVMTKEAVQVKAKKDSLSSWLTLLPVRTLYADIMQMFSGPCSWKLKLFDGHVEEREEREVKKHLGRRIEEVGISRSDSSFYPSVPSVCLPLWSLLRPGRRWGVGEP